MSWLRKSGALLCLGMLCAAATGDPPVADAAMRGDIEEVRALLRAGAEVSAAQGDGMTALHWAAERGDVEMTKTLIAAGARLEAVTRLGDYTPLHLAARAGKSSTVSTLLQAGSNPQPRSTTGGAAPLHFAAASGNTDVIAALLDHGADVNVAESSWGQTPLMFAAAYNRLDAVDILLARGADVSITTHVVEIPARQAEDRAMRQRRDQVLSAFREQSGERNPSPTHVQAALKAARTPQPEPADLQEEAVDYEEARPEPLSYGQLVGTQGGLTALLHAVREGHGHTAVALLDGGADIDQVSAGDHTSPMLMAMINGHYDLGLQLLELGADPALANDSGSTPLYAALNTHWHPKARYPQQMAYLQQKASYLDVMETLLRHRVDPNVRLKKHLWYMSYTFDQLGVDTMGATAFWRAAYATDVPAMELLIEHGADPTIATIHVRAGGRRSGGSDGNRDPSGLPPVPVGGPAVYPIHAATGVGYGQGYAGNAHRHAPDGWLPSVKYLVGLGADVNARDYNGNTPLHHAASRGDNQVILYLVERGADVTALNRRGQTTADMANGPTQRVQIFPRTVELLRALGSDVTPKSP